MNFKILAFLVVIFSIFTLTFRLLSIPPGIETDEGSISYNASLISRNLRDQNDRFMPFFILSSDRMDWKQPVLIYLSAISFKIFGTSLLVFKMVNIVCTLTALGFVYFLCKLIFNSKYYGILGVIITLTSPIVLITSRIGNESIQPLFYSSLWLLSLVLYRKYNKNIYLFVCAIALGIGLYCFKGMRIIIPIWFTLTVAYLFVKYLRLNGFDLLIKENFSLSKSFKRLFSIFKKTILNRKFLKSLTVFILTILPFIVVIPLLEWKYPGSVFDRQHIPQESYRHYIHYWLTNLNLSFFFTEAEVAQTYRTISYGPFLLAILPLFLLGIIKSLKKIDFKFFILICFIATPFLFGVAKSLDYIHRLIGIIPFLVIITIQGYQELNHYLVKNFKYGGFKKLFSIVTGTSLLLFSLYNYFDFASYYYFEYPKLESTRYAFGNKDNLAFKTLSQESKKRKLTPYIQDDIYGRGGDANNFFNVAYFNKQLNTWKLGDNLPPGSILLTEVEKIVGYQNINAQVSPLNILIKTD